MACLVVLVQEVLSIVVSEVAPNRTGGVVLCDSMSDERV
jgi:hypothetical protein